MFPRHFIYFYLVIFLATLAVAGGILPREFAFVFLAAMLIYIALVPITEATQFVIAAIPLYLALPLIQSFDNMASWRLIIGVLFLAWLFRYKIISRVRNRLGKSLLGKSLRWGDLFGGILPLEWIALALGMAGMLSLLTAEYPLVGVKKLLFLTNIGLLYIIVRFLGRDRKTRDKLLFSGLVAGCVALLIGFFQYFLIIFFSLYDFWQWWAGQVIPVFYGHALGELLTISNTWFSYYAEAPSTLRMFSVFPDSHSFALFSILISALALFFVLKKIIEQKAEGSLQSIKLQNLASVFWKKNSNEPRMRGIVYAAIWVSASLAIYFSGSRGTWFTAGILGLLGIVGLICYRPFNISRKRIMLFALILGLLSGFTVYLARNIALFVAFGGCARIPTLCGKAMDMVFSFPENIMIPILIVAASFCTVFIIEKITRKLAVTILWTHLAPVFLSIIIFVMLLPPASFVSSQTHGFGVEADEAILAFKRAESALDITETSNRARLDIWVASVRAILARPFSGVGLGNYPLILGEEISAGKRGASAHNLYLDFGSELGIAGFILILWFFIEILRMCRCILQPSNSGYQIATSETLFAAIFFVYILWIMGYNFFDVVLLNDKVALLFALLLGVLSSIFYERRAATRSQ